MSVMIQNIEINSCGPISKFNEKIFPLTVVYAGNEKGKTTIVENIIASLFRDQKDGMYPFLRGNDFIGASKVTITGIKERPIICSPANRKNKLDILLLDESASLPRSLFNLLFVRGAETSIVHDGGGINKTVIKNLISMQHIYEVIKSRIPNEVGYSEIENGTLKPGKRIGRIKSYYESISHLNKLNEISSEFDSRLSQTRFIKLNNEKKNLKEKLDQIHDAKRYRAWYISEKISAIDEKLSRSDENILEKVDDALKKHSLKSSEYYETSESLKKYSHTQENSDWINAARDILTSTGVRKKNIPQIISFISGICFF